MKPEINLLADPFNEKGYEYPDRNGAPPSTAALRSIFCSCLHETRREIMDDLANEPLRVFRNSHLIVSRKAVWQWLYDGGQTDDSLFLPLLESIHLWQRRWNLVERSDQKKWMTARAFSTLAGWMKDAQILQHRSWSDRFPVYEIPDLTPPVPPPGLPRLSFCGGNWRAAYTDLVRTQARSHLRNHPLFDFIDQQDIEKFVSHAAETDAVQKYCAEVEKWAANIGWIKIREPHNLIRNLHWTITCLTVKKGGRPVSFSVLSEDPSILPVAEETEDQSVIVDVSTVSRSVREILDLIGLEIPSHLRRGQNRRPASTLRRRLGK